MSKPKLNYPANWDADLAKDVANGCGPAGSKWKAWIVPDKIYFVSVTAACRIHDFMYYMGKTMADKDEADDVFLENMNAIFDAQPWWNKPLNPLRRRTAKLYYRAVAIFGKSAFLEDKAGVNDDVEPTEEQLMIPELKVFASNYLKFKKMEALKQVA